MTNKFSEKKMTPPNCQAEAKVQCTRNQRALSTRARNIHIQTRVHELLFTFTHLFFYISLQPNYSYYCVYVKEKVNKLRLRQRVCGNLRHMIHIWMMNSNQKSIQNKHLEYSFFSGVSIKINWIHANTWYITNCSTAYSDYIPSASSSSSSTANLRRWFCGRGIRHRIEAYIYAPRKSS